MENGQTVQHSVEAYNLSASSENKIHDDAIAKQFGFNGGLVPGVEVYAYMINPILQFYGEDWLHRGYAKCRLLKPVYDGEYANITGEVSPENELSLCVESANTKCATGVAKMTTPDRKVPSNEFSEIDLPPFDSRPDASPSSLRVGSSLGTFKQVMMQEDQEQYLNDVRETNDLFIKQQIIHPGWILRMANRALSMNVKLGPWIHVGSTIQNIRVAHCGDTLAAHPIVTNVYDHKGHGFVEMEVTIIDDAQTPISHIEHTAIYKPRQVVEAA